MCRAFAVQPALFILHPIHYRKIETAKLIADGYGEGCQKGGFRQGNGPRKRQEHCKKNKFAKVSISLEFYTTRAGFQGVKTGHSGEIVRHLQRLQQSAAHRHISYHSKRQHFFYVRAQHTRKKNVKKLTEKSQPFKVYFQVQLCYSDPWRGHQINTGCNNHIHKKGLLRFVYLTRALTRS